MSVANIVANFNTVWRQLTTTKPTIAVNCVNYSVYGFALIMAPLKTKYQTNLLC